MKQQLCYLFRELSLIIGHRYYRWMVIWFEREAGILISYRLDRGLFLFFGQRYSRLRPLFLPALCIHPHSIDYRADIGPSLRILHPVLRVSVSPETIAGECLTLAGGNQIEGAVIIGSHVTLGANATIIGPIMVADHTQIGAGETLQP